MPRSGTTSLSMWLDNHPEVALSRPKEPGFFAQDLEMGTTEQSATAYARAFAGAQSAIYRLDATPWYLFSKEAGARIMESVPEARFIGMVRNPADQIVSQHRHHVKVGFERQPDLMRAISHPAPPDPADFRTGLDYLAAARIGEQLERFFEHVPRGRVKIIDFDDLRADSQGVYRDLIDWLGLPLIEPNEYDRRNPGMEVRSQALHRLFLAGKMPSKPRFVRAASHRLDRLNLRPPATSESDHVRRWLLQQLEPDIERLERVLDQSFEHWRADRRPSPVDRP